MIAPGDRAEAGFGYFFDGGSFVQVDSTIYQLGMSTGGAPVFNGSTLGTFVDDSGGLLLEGFQTFTFENNGDTVHSGRLQWRIASPSGGTVRSGMIATNNFVNLGGGDKLHENLSAGIDLTAGLWGSSPSPKTFTLEVYTEADATYNGNAFPAVNDTIWQEAGGGTRYDSSNGTVGDGLPGPVLFSASFTIIPEPSRAVLIGLACLVIGFRRQR